MTPEEVKESIKQNQEKQRIESLKVVPEVIKDLNLQLLQLSKDPGKFQVSTVIAPRLDTVTVANAVCQHYRERGWSNVESSRGPTYYSLTFHLQA